MEGDQGETMNNVGFDELPIEIIQHIQSFLARRDAANAGLLSKSWYDAWFTRPILDFSDVLPCFNETSYEEQGCRLWQSVRRTMKRYKQSNLKLEKLVLTLDSNYGYGMCPVLTRLVDELFQDASILGVNELHSTQEECYGHQWSSFFPAHLAFAIRSLTKLFVRSGIITRDDPIVVQCPFLVSLRLHSVGIENEDITSILLGCPLIEILDIQCYDATDIDVSNLHNLVVLNICDKRYREYIRTSFDSVTNGGINEFHGLRDVRLTAVEIDDTFFQNFSSRFPCIEELALVGCIGYKDIHISSKSLKSLTLRLKGKKVDKAEFEVPNIRRFEFQSPDIPAFSFQTVSREWESHVKLSCLYENLGVSWFVRLVEFIGELSLCNLYLHLKVDKSLPIWAKNLSRSPPVVVEHLLLSYHPQGQALLCALFGWCQPKAIEIYKFERDSEIYSFAAALHGLFQHQNSFSRIHELLEIDVEIFQESEWQNIPLQHFVEDFPKFPFEKYICFRLKWGASSVPEPS